MAVRSILMLVAAVILLSSPPLLEGQSVLAPLLPIPEMGFSPSSMQDTIFGIPIYTTGDQMWAGFTAGAQGTVTISYPSLNNFSTGPFPLVSGAPVKVFSFGPADPVGEWMATFNLSSTIYQVPFAVTDPGPALVPIEVGVGVAQAALVQKFTLPHTDSYDIQACVAGGVQDANLSFGLTGGAGGALTMGFYGNVSQVSLTSVQNPFSFWFELFATYAYQSAQTTVTTGLKVGTSSTVVAGTNASQRFSVPLSLNAPLRAGRYELRTFIRTVSGLSVREDPFLRLDDGSWFSLHECEPLVNVREQIFSVASDLNSSTSTWPTDLYTMFTLGGVDSYSRESLPKVAAALVLKHSNVTLAGVAVTASGADLTSWDEYGSTVYLTSARFPTTTLLVINCSGVASETRNVTITSPYSKQTVSVPLAEISAMATRSGSPAANSTFIVTAAGGPPVKFSSPTGSINLALPPGSYNITAAYGQVARSTPVNLLAGNAVTVRLTLDVTRFPTLLAGLAALGVATVILNVFLWRRFLGLRRLYG